MKVVLGEEGLKKSFQKDFPEETACQHCGAQGARIAFVAHEMDETKGSKNYVCKLHKNEPKEGGLWVHDSCCVAVYFCRRCLEASALYNQA